MPEVAASGLWTSASDLARLVIALIESVREASGFIPQKLARDMMSREPNSWHGLGPRVNGESEKGWVFHHGGANDSYRAWIEGHLATGDGLVVLTNGARGDALYIEIRNAAADAMGWKINAPVIAPAIDLDEETARAFEGRFRPNPSYPASQRQQMNGWIYDLDLIVALNDGRLALRFAGDDAAHDLIPLAPGRFLVKGINTRVGVAELEFHRNAFGEAHEVTLALNNARSHYLRAP